MNVQFEDLYLAPAKNSDLNILKGISGRFKRGQLTAIMGCSGAGKSSLLNTLSGLRKTGVTGRISPEKEESSYITHDDQHQSFLTVLELTRFSCRLKMNETESEEAIHEVLKKLNLSTCRDQRVETLSGGERKRLSIALELVKKPSVLFLDEPTTGLDEVNAVQIVQQLKDLAAQECTMVCTIHQPSSRIFEMFDLVYILAHGVCVYQGSPRSLIEFLDSMEISCPITYNPADFIIDLCEEEDETQLAIRKLSTYFQNGKRTYGETDAFIFEEQSPQNQFKVPPFQQFRVLLQMIAIQRNRDHFKLLGFPIIFIGTSTFLGLVFYNRGREAQKMHEHFFVCLAFVAIPVLVKFMIPVLAYPFDIKLAKMEFFNQWYTYPAYYYSLMFSKIPCQIYCCILYSTIIYLLVGFHLDIWRYVSFTGIVILLAMIGDVFGTVVGSIFSPTNGATLGPMAVLPLAILAMYGFDFADKVPVVLKLLLHANFIRSGMMALLIITFGYGSPKLDCWETFCFFEDPQKFIRWLHLEENQIWIEFVILLLNLLFFRLLLYFSIKRRFAI